MSLQLAAQHLASKGRGPDTTLVHMAPREVAGLQALAMAHGGTLTTNPDTGLPEAGFLKNLLPTLIGAGLMFATGGASAGLTPGMIGLGIGGLQTLRTGSLAKGLMAGLGAYGGAGMMGSVLGAGSGAITAGADAAGAGMGSVTPPVAPTALPYPEPGVAGVGANEFAQYAQPPVPVTPPVQTVTAPDLYRNQMDIASDRAAALRDAGTSGQFKTGLSAIADKPSSFFTKDNLKYGAAALAPMLFQEPKTATPPSDSEQFRYAYSPGPIMPPTRMGDVGEYTYFRPSYTRLAADGGLMDLPVQRMSDRNEAETMMANGGQMYAGGGLSHLGDFSDGGRLLRGPGDGVSDSIPASIADKRPARLADGEFVVPARIVSELGNGSTEAGARKLYAMMDRVQKNRNKTVGKGKVAVDSRSEKLLPA